VRAAAVFALVNAHLLEARPVADGYSLRDVMRLLGVSRAVVTGLVDAGFVTPQRGPRRELRFTFRDLVLLRTAQGLSQARIPPARIVRSLRRLRERLPETMPLAGLRIEALGDDVVVSEGEAQWRPDDGQYMLQFGVSAPGGRLVFLGPGAAGATAIPAANENWFERGASMEGSDPEAACDAYRRAIEADRDHRDAYVNLGRLLHERGRLAEAVLVYRQAIDRIAGDAMLHFNLGVLQEDLGEREAAIASYRSAVAIAPDLADAHFNLARLFEAMGSQREALRHWSAFRKLTVQR
jgi:tetratricopeptide (TPR) repeat protein